MVKDYIETIDLEKSFGGLQAIDKFTLRVKKGEIFGLLGPNAAGKTTLIKILCSLLMPTGGAAYVLGKRVPDRHIAPLIGYMPQELALYTNVSVHENVEFYGAIFGLSKDQILKRERELLRLIDLEAHTKAIVHNLSGGMQRRVSLACALLHEPPLLFLDEPTVGVDPQLRMSFWDYFEGLKDGGTTILITTHYMDEARRCDRVGFMHAGKLIAEGSPHELLDLTHTDSLEDAFLILSREERG
ncbi:MAG: ABC transporter ATP-binding protein [Euryarchaeota archaeon]|nr:ABC transporter ATP-binding protein [Euryarchaeota archaeon]